MTRELKQNCQQKWGWEMEGAPEEVVFSEDKLEAYFFTDPVEDSTGSVAIRGSCPLREGDHYWEVVFLEPLSGVSVMVGVGTSRADLHPSRGNYDDLLGRDDQSWGLCYKGTLRHGGKTTRFCEPFYKPFTTLGCHVDMQRGTLTLYRNGEKLGVAARGLNRVKEPLYPMVSSSGPAEVRLGGRTYRAPCLFERCCLTVVRETRGGGVAGLPLPGVVRQHLAEGL